MEYMETKFDDWVSAHLGEELNKLCDYLKKVIPYMTQVPGIHVAAALTVNEDDNDIIKFLRVDSSCDDQMEREVLRPLMARALAGSLSCDEKVLRYEYGKYRYERPHDINSAMVKVDKHDRGISINGTQCRVLVVVNELSTIPYDRLDRLAGALIAYAVQLMDEGIRSHYS